MPKVLVRFLDAASTGNPIPSQPCESFSLLWLTRGSLPAYA
jgi:hypothetical protein